VIRAPSGRVFAAYVHAAAELQTTRLQANAATLAPLNITRELVRGLALGQDEADADGDETQYDNYNQQHQLQPQQQQQQQQRTARCASSLSEKDMQQLESDQVGH
jgi:hypothetical protein